VPVAHFLKTAATLSNPINPVDNHLIRLLPEPDRERLLAACEHVSLHLSGVVCEHGAPTLYAYFPLAGFLSLVAHTAQNVRLEVGMVGREGMLGAELALGVTNAPFHALVQGAGHALRLSAPALTSAIAQSVALQDLLYRYLGVTTAQLATSAACLQLHHATARLARWILMSHDRAETPCFEVTDEFMAYMMGQSPSRTMDAVQALKDQGLITLQGIDLHVLNRTGLEAAACPCYDLGRSNYRHYIDRG